MREYKIASWIPAKGRSYRIPKKNIKMMAGKPMMAWTIEASLESKYIDRTFVSTESEEVKKIALEYGAEVIDRPSEFSEDETGGGLIRYHFIYYLLKNKLDFDFIVELYATSPLRTEKTIDGVFDLYFEARKKNQFVNVLTVYEIKDMRPSSLSFIDEAGYLGYIKDKDAIEKEWIQRPTYRDTPGISIYDLSLDDIKYYDIHSPEYVERKDIPYIVKIDECVDVNTPYDFTIAEALLKERIKREGG